MSDFDEMMARKKEERQSSRRRKRNVDIINDSDDLIVDMLRRMKEAAEVSKVTPGGVNYHSTFSFLIIKLSLRNPKVAKIRTSCCELHGIEMLLNSHFRRLSTSVFKFLVDGRQG